MALLKKHRRIKKNKSYPSYPWRENTSFQLLVDGVEFYPSMLEQITKATQSILIEQYLIKSGHVFTRFIDAIRQACQRGVKVYMLLDHFGCSEMKEDDLYKINNAGVHLQFFHPVVLSSLKRSLQRDHRKITIIDSKVAFIGGAGIHDENATSNAESKMWHDVMIKIQGDAVNDCICEFTQLWNSLTNDKINTVLRTQHNEDSDSGRLLLSQPGANHIIRSAINRITKEKKRIWIASPYFITTRKLRHHLKHAAKRGVDVRLLTPGPVTDHQWIRAAARRYYHRLLANGIKIYEYQPRFIHAKLILCEDWLSIGSSNLDQWNQHWNLEANIAIQSESINSQLTDLFEKDFEQSKCFTFEKWKARPWSSRVIEWIAGHYIGMLQRVMRLFNKPRI